MTSSTKRVCVHLFESKDADHHQSFTGNGLEYDLVCSTCKSNPDTIGANLRLVDERSFEEIQREGYWDGVIGQPEILRRPSALRFDHQVVELAKLKGVHFLDLQPVVSLPDVWLGLSSDGALIRAELSSHAVETLMRVPNGLVDLQQKITLRTTRAGNLIALANTHGQHGVVVDATSGQITLSLDRGAYHEGVSAFPVVFVEHEGRSLVIHGTAWNRLDVSDATTGELLTARGPTSYKEREQRPPHYLDYFHGGLAVSPSQEFVVDNGWVWHPSGIVTTWSLSRWLRDNVWESEDGPSKKSLCHRGYFWDGPLCWISNRKLAVWGYGGDDEWLIAAVCLFDVVTGKREHWFPGPKGSLAFDEYLFSWDQNGLAVWDISTGEQFSADEGLNPTGYHPMSKCFATFMDNGIVRLSRLG